MKILFFIFLIKIKRKENFKKRILEEKQSLTKIVSEYQRFFIVLYYKQFFLG